MSLREAVASVLFFRSKCVPDGAVILTVLLPSYDREHTGDAGTRTPSVRSLQFARVRSERCLTRRIISLSFEARAARAPEDGIGTHASARRFWNPNARATIAQWGTGRDKYAPIAEALQVANSVLWLDPAVMLLSNPFDALSVYAPARSADILYQAEAPCWLTANSRSPPSELSRATHLEAACARQQIYDRVVYVRNATIAAALTRLPYFARGRRTVGTRSELASFVSTASDSNRFDSGAFGLVDRPNRSSWEGSTFLRMRAQALPLPFLMHSYEAFRMGIVSTCPPNAVAYAANQLSSGADEAGKSTKHKAGASGTARPSREERMARQVAVEMWA